MSFHGHPRGQGGRQPNVVSWTCDTAQGEVRAHGQALAEVLQLSTVGGLCRRSPVQSG